MSTTLQLYDRARAAIAARGFDPEVQTRIALFVGAAKCVNAAILAAKNAGLRRKLVGIELKGPGIPRSGCKLFDADGGDSIGFVTSGTQSPSLKKAIGIAYVAAARSEIGSRVLVEIRDKRIPAEVIPTPFYKRPY